MKKMTVKLKMLLIIPALFVSCTQAPDVIPGYEGTRLNPDFLSDVEDVKALFVAMATGDQAGMNIYLHEKFFVNGPAIDDFYNRQEFIDRSLYFSEWFDQAKLSGDIYYSFICDEYEGRPELIGKWVFTWGSLSFRSKASGKEIEHPYHYAVRIRDGKIDFMGRYYDRQDRSRQLGYTLLPPEAADQ